MDSATEFLGNLVGEWDLTGQMGETPLHQAATGRWVLGGLFVELYFTSLLPPPSGGKRYEAVYHIGYNAAQDRYVLHLLDTFGVATECSVGLGQREGDSIPFIFAYASGPFTNRFTWEAAPAAWTMEQTYIQDGQPRTFAVKRMVRAMGDGR